jgi:alpha-amylase
MKKLSVLLFAASFSLVGSCKKDSTHQTFTSPSQATEIKLQSITLDNTTLSLKQSETHQVQATLLPSNAWDKTLTYSSSDTTIAKVSSAGLIQAVKPGSATINVINNRSSVIAQCKLTVTPILVTSIQINSESLTFYVIGATDQLKATILPDNAENQKITWNSSDPSKVSVDSNGQITSIANGTAIITARSTDGGNIVSPNCPIIVQSK